MRRRQKRDKYVRRGRLCITETREAQGELPGQLGNASCCAGLWNPSRSLAQRDSDAGPSILEGGQVGQVNQSRGPRLQFFVGRPTLVSQWRRSILGGSHFLVQTFLIPALGTRCPLQRQDLKHAQIHVLIRVHLKWIWGGGPGHPWRSPFIRVCFL